MNPEVLIIHTPGMYFDDEQRKIVVPLDSSLPALEPQALTAVSGLVSSNCSWARSRDLSKDIYFLTWLTMATISIHQDECKSFKMNVSYLRVLGYHF